MNGGSKLILSQREMELVTSTDWILTKRAIIEKVNELFGLLAERLQEIIKEQLFLSAPVMASTPKIAKGENYQLLPYVILDYPRCFERENIFAVRTMFWWGNFFSCTLHLSGRYKLEFEQALIRNLELLQQNDLYICVNTNEWEHHFKQDNYIAVRAIERHDLAAMINGQPFIKLAVKFSLQQWHEIDVLLKKSFVTVIQLLQY